MKPFPKLMRSKTSPAIAYIEGYSEDNIHLKGTAVTEGLSVKKGYYSAMWDANALEDYEFDTKDAELRLECLKLASNNKNGQSQSAIMKLAQEYYEWVTKNEQP